MEYLLDEPLEVTSSVTIPSTTPLSPGDTNYWTISNSDLDLFSPAPGIIVLAITGSAVVGGTSTKAVNISLQVRNTSARSTVFYTVPEFQIPAGTTPPYKRTINLPSGVYFDWVAADVVVVNSLSENEFDPTGGGTENSTQYISSVSDNDTCWWAIDTRNIKISLTQSLYYNEGFIFNGNYQGIDTPVFDFNLNQMDLLRFYNSGSGWSTKSEYRVVSVYPYIDSTGSYYNITIDRDLNLSDTSGSVSYPAKICKYIVLKRLPDETNVILNYDLAQPITQDGLLRPQYIDETVRDNSGNVVKSLKQQNLIESTP
jgi:hypothetical protein